MSKKIVQIISEWREKGLGLEVEVLLCHVMQCTKSELFLKRDCALSDVLSPDAEVLFEEYLVRLESGEPLAYICQQKEFYGREFSVTSGVLIPRPETEQLVEVTLAQVYKLYEGGLKHINIVELGYGSGCICVTLTLELLEYQKSHRDFTFKMYGTDISGSAYECAVMNLLSYKLESVVDLRVGNDLFEPFLQSGEKFDVIVANLPYIPDDSPEVEANVRRFEPHEALFGGRDGFDIYRRMLQQIVEYSYTPAFVCIEIGYEQGEIATREMSTVFPDAEIEVLKDLSGFDRLVTVCLDKNLTSA